MGLGLGLGQLSSMHRTLAGGRIYEPVDIVVPAVDIVVPAIDKVVSAVDIVVPAES